MMATTVATVGWQLLEAEGMACAADGSTYQEALENVEVVIREWIDTANELGRAIRKPKGRPILA